MLPVSEGGPVVEPDTEGVDEVDSAGLPTVEDKDVSPDSELVIRVGTVDDDVPDAEVPAHPATTRVATQTTPASTVRMQVGRNDSPIGCTGRRTADGAGTSPAPSTAW